MEDQADSHQPGAVSRQGRANFENGVVAKIANRWKERVTDRNLERERASTNRGDQRKPPSVGGTWPGRNHLIVNLSLNYTLSFTVLSKFS